MTISQFCGLRRAQVPGADPGSDYPRQPASSRAQVPARHTQIVFRLSRRNGLPVEMQKQKVFKVKPDTGLQAAGLRAPGAGIDAQFVKIGKNGFQVLSQFFSHRNDRLKFVVANSPMKIQRPVVFCLQ